MKRAVRLVRNWGERRVSGLVVLEGKSATDVGMSEWCCGHVEMTIWGRVSNVVSNARADHKDGESRAGFLKRIPWDYLRHVLPNLFVLSTKYLWSFKDFEETLLSPLNGGNQTCSAVRALLHEAFSVSQKAMDINENK